MSAAIPIDLVAQSHYETLIAACLHDQPADVPMALQVLSRHAPIFKAGRVDINREFNKLRGCTVLHLACRAKSREVLEAAIVLGADPGIVLKGQMGVAQTAILYLAPECVAALAEHGIDFTPLLHWAASTSTAATLRAVLATGVNPNVLDKGGLTPLQSVVFQNGIEENVAVLIAAGADLTFPIREDNRFELIPGPVKAIIEAARAERAMKGCIREELMGAKAASRPMGL